MNRFRRPLFLGGVSWLLVLLPLATASGQSGTLPFYGEPAIMTAPGQLSQMFVRDFTRDGVPDIAVITQPATPSGNLVVTVYPGVGDGSFGSGIPTDTGTRSGGAYIGDFDGDGNPDLAFVQTPDEVYGTTDVGVVVGDGDGTFQSYRLVGSLAVDVRSGAYLVADLDGDGRTDIANTGYWGGLFETKTGTVFLWGNADRSFTRTTEEGDALYLVGAADVNGDGNPDLVRGTSANSRLSVRLGLGNRTFGSPIENTSVGQVSTCVVADINGDGKLDLVVRYGQDQVGLLTGNGDGTFGSVVSLGTIRPPTTPGLRAWDVTGDGRLDLVVDAYEGIVILVNNGDGSFRRVTVGSPRKDSFPFHLAHVSLGVADLDNDGRTDFVVTWSGQQFGVYVGTTVPTTTLALSSATTTLSQAVTLTATVAPATFSGPVTFYDGLQVLGSAQLSGGQAVLTTSVLMPGSHSLRAAYGGVLSPGRAGFSAAQSHTVSAAASSGLFAGPSNPAVSGRLTVGDVNRDGRADLIATGPTCPGVLLGNGDATFLAPWEQSCGYDGWQGGLALGDFDQDGSTDVFLGGLGYHNAGDGTFPNYFEDGQTAYELVLAADLNGDGKLDEVLGRGQALAVRLGLGDGRFADDLAYSNATMLWPDEMELGDFNGDGSLDLLVIEKAANRVSVLLGNGDGTFQAPVSSTRGTGPSSPVLADFSGDGKLDLAFVNAGTDRIVVQFGKGDGTFLSPAEVTIGGTLTRMVAADLNGDGRLDLAVVSGAEGRVLVLPGNGNGTFGAPSRYYLGGTAVDLAAADFNRDGRMDLAVAWYTSSRAYLTPLLGVSPSASAVALTVTPSSSTLGQLVTMTAQVTPTTAAGWVTFVDGATPLGTARVTGGQAVLETRLLGSGTHLLRATFSGDGALFSSSSSAAVIRKVAASRAFAFGPPVQLSSGAASLVAQGDFNGDGTVDLAIYDGSTGILTAMLGQGDGQFSVSMSRNIYGSVSRVVAADMDRDGHVDLLYDTGGFLRGRGDGTFEAPVSVQSSDLFVADVNGDGVPDLAARTSVLLGRGDGSFESPLPSSNLATWLAGADDFNGDGMADLVLVDYNQGYAYVLLAAGDGLFQPAVRYPTVAHPRRVAMGDLNGDGHPDLGIADASAGGRIAIMLGAGDGTFENWGDVVTGLTDPNYLGTCDADGDGKVDLLVAASHTVKLLRGTGTGTFQAAEDYAALPEGALAFPTDLNGDGRPDLLVYDSSDYPATVSMRMAVYASAVGLAAAPAHPGLSDEVTLTAAVTPGDAAGTVTFTDGASVVGHAPIVAGQAVLRTSWLPAGVHRLRATYNGDPLHYVSSVSPAITLTVEAGASGGFVATGATLATGRGPRSLAAGDLNGDGTQDLVVANATSNTVSVFLATGGGAFATRVSYNTGTAPVAVAVADLDGDGILDVAVANSGSNSVSVFVGNGNGSFKAAVNYTLPGAPQSLVLADVTGDGATDIVVGTSNGASWGGASVLMLRNDGVDGSGQITFYSTELPPWNTRMDAVVGVGAADLNGDGMPDVALVQSTGQVLALLQQVNGRFANQSQTVAGGTPAALAIGDFDADGKLDVATANSGSNDAGVLIGHGDGAFSSAVPFSAGTGPSGIVTTDADGDGRLDLLVVNAGGNTLAILRGLGNGSFVPGGSLATGGAPRAVVVGDFDGNGITDLAVANSGDDSVSIFLGVAATTPGVSGVTPPSGSTAGGTVVTVTGTGFLVGGTAVTIGGVAATNVTVTNSTLLTARTAAHPAGAVDVVVTTVGGTGTLPGGFTYAAAARARADFRGTGTSDILWHHVTNGQLWMWPMAGGGVTSQLHLADITPEWEVRGVGDQTGDGRADLLWRHKTTGVMFLWAMDGSRVVSYAYVGSVDPVYDIVGTGDYNGDGKADVLWRDQRNGDLWLWVMDGATIASVAKVGTVPLGYAVVGSGDLDGDGRADVVWRHASNGEVWVWLMDGATAVTVRCLGIVGNPNWTIVGVDDVNGDRRADLVWRNVATGDVSTWLMQGTSIAQIDWVGTVGDLNYRIVGTGDYDGDGTADLLWHHAVTGDVWVWQMHAGRPPTPTFVSRVADVGYRINAPR